MKLLLIEDEIPLADALAHILRTNNYAIDMVHDGIDGLDYALTGQYDIIILDLMLPGMNGFEILKTLRQKGLATPVLLLTARDSLSDKVEGLDLGADDYLTKPFMTDELLARLRVLGRRKNDITPSPLLSYKDLSLNPHSLSLSCGEKNIVLTLKESQLLEYFLSHPEKICSKNELIEKVWGYDSNAEDNHVEVYISFLRKKIAYLQATATLQTIRGMGYKLITKESLSC